jgi:hypothetical protein
MEAVIIRLKNNKLIKGHFLKSKEGEFKVLNL